MASAGSSIGAALGARRAGFALASGGLSAGSPIDASAVTLSADEAALDNQGPIGELGGGVDGTEGEMDAYRWLVAWAVLILVLALLNRSRLGHIIIYYALALMLILLVVVNYGFFAWALAPFQFIGRAVNPQDTTSASDTTSANGLPPPGSLATAIRNAAAAQNGNG